ncbi:MAG: flippase-like domain-containing protein [Polyangiaceae bacterium]
MSRRGLVRGVQLVVAITLLTFAVLVWRSVSASGVDLRDGLADVRPGWLLVAALLALQEGVCGGLRIWVLGRVLAPALALRTAVVSEFVLMFCAGVTPGQVGAAPAQVAVLVHGGMRFAEVATAELLTASCTIVFFLLSAVTITVLRHTGLMVVHGGDQLDWLVGVSLVVFGAALLGLVAAAAWPPLLKRGFAMAGRALAPPGRALWRVLRRTRWRAWAERRLARPGSTTARLQLLVDDFHAGFRVYLRRGKRAYLTAMLLTLGFFCSRFAVAYFILLGLGLDTHPSSFVTIGPPLVQVVLVQALLNFALYLSPTPGASGVAEAGSTTLMAPWVHGAFELPYLVLWRLLAMFLCMFVGGIYVFRYLGTDVLEERVAANEAERLRREEARRAAAANARPAEQPPVR